MVPLRLSAFHLSSSQFVMTANNVNLVLRTAENLKSIFPALFPANPLDFSVATEP